MHLIAILPLINLTLMLISSNPFYIVHQSVSETNQDQEGAETIGINPINNFSQSMANKSTSQSFYSTIAPLCLTNAYSNHCAIGILIAIMLFR